MKKYERKLKQISLKRQANTHRTAGVAAGHKDEKAETEREKSSVSN
ncbi:hypothetical protein [Ectobacillus panaciterrae]|nr:hypothetical protein [Ectobacillus panaciterrae]